MCSSVLFASASAAVPLHCWGVSQTRAWLAFGVTPWVQIHLRHTGILASVAVPVPCGTFPEPEAGVSLGSVSGLLESQRQLPQHRTVERFPNPSVARVWRNASVWLCLPPPREARVLACSIQARSQRPYIQKLPAQLRGTAPYIRALQTPPPPREAPLVLPYSRLSVYYTVLHESAASPRRHCGTTLRLSCLTSRSSNAAASPRGPIDPRRPHGHAGILHRYMVYSPPREALHDAT